MMRSHLVSSDLLQLQLIRQDLRSLLLRCSMLGTTTEEDAGRRGRRGRFTITAEVQFTGGRRGSRFPSPTNPSDSGDECDFFITVKDGFAYYIIVKVFNGTNVLYKKSLYYHTYQDTFGRNQNANITFFNMPQLNQLLKIAIKFVKNANQSPRWVDILFRNNSQQYFDEIMVNNQNVMAVGPKNINGDPRCPINLKIRGLDFSCGNSSSLIRTSLFGETRFITGINSLVNPHKDKLYFADFFCHRNRHHITLVVTKLGSEADEYCSKNLRQLPLISKHGSTANPFFYFNQSKKQFFCTYSVWIELYYTEAVPITNPNMQLQQNRFARRSVGYGKPKNSACKSCHIKAPICKKNNCQICTRLIKSENVKSHSNGATIPCSIDFNYTCRDCNLIYLIQCNICQMQYVGQTGNRLSDRINQHIQNIQNGNESVPLVDHFTSHPPTNGNGINFNIRVLEFILETESPEREREIRMDRERYWIRQLDTLAPNGINKQG